MLLIGLHALKQEVVNRLLPTGLTVTNTASSTLALAISSGKTLTLTSNGDFNLTIPATGTAALGTGTANYVTKWSATNTLTNSLIRDDGATIGIGAAPSSEYFKVYKSFSSAGYVYGTLLDFYNTGGGSIVGVRIISTILNSNASDLYTYWASSRVYNTTANNYTITNQYCGYFQNTFYMTNTGNLSISGVSYGAMIKSPSVSSTGGGTLSIAMQRGLYIENQGTPGAGSATITNAIGLEILDQSGANTLNISLRTNAGNVIFNEGGDANTDFRVESDNYDALLIDASNDSIDIMHNASGKLAFYAATPVTQQVLATGAGATVDDVITFLQTVGLCKQS